MYIEANINISIKENKVVKLFIKTCCRSCYIKYHPIDEEKVKS